MMNLQLIYLTEDEVETQTYASFFEKYHGIGTFKNRKERIHWYFRSEGFKLLVAVADGNYVGQTCAYRTTAIVHGEAKEWWWGVDGFVLEEMRGKGIGKALQKKLHEDCPNFSSASYSSTNGIIKKKCGGRGVLEYRWFYCPVSCYFSLYLELILKKLVSRKIVVPRVRLPYLYSSINGSNKKIDYSIRELTPSDFNGQLSTFMEDCLKETDFHILRSETYLKWKYLQNPSINHIGLEVMKDGNREAVVFFSCAYVGRYTVSKAKVAKILDAIIKPGSNLTQKELLSMVIQYFKRANESIDGLLTIIPSDYRPRIKYPVSGSFSMLSTIDTPLLTKGYLSYSDQDMEQMNEYNG
jgi:GNAT superfamily N-acetyltransferase